MTGYGNQNQRVPDRMNSQIEDPGLRSPPFAATEYLSRLLPKNTTSLFNFLPNSTMLFSLAMCEEKVVTIIPEFLFWIVKKTSSRRALAIFSLGVFRSLPEYNESTMKQSTPSLEISFKTL